MRRPVLHFILLLSLGTNFQAQEVHILNRTVQAHGFATQGFVYTDGNNWLTMNTRQGSFAMTDMGFNLSSQLTDRLRVGAQVYDRNLGQLGQWHPSLDWAVGDYRFKNWLGIRAGKVKTTMGLYNDSQDLDCLRVFALLPQGVYPTDLRDTTIAHTGGDIYGSVMVGHRWGDLSYTAFAGRRTASVYSGYPYLISQFGFFLRSMTGPQYGADLRWNTPVKGLLIGASRMNQEITGAGTMMNPFDPSAPPVPYRATTKAYWINQYYGEYQWRSLRLDAEYQRIFERIPVFPGSDVNSDTRAWYVAGSYHISKHLGVGTYYSRYSNSRVTSGAAEMFLPTDTNTSLPRNRVFDEVISARVDFNRHVYVKVEGHFMDGYGIGAYPDGFYPQQNSHGFKNDTNALVVKTGFYF